MSLSSSWFHNPSQLFRSSDINIFWPNAKQSDAQRIDAASRFVLYAGSILYILRRDSRILVLMLLSIGVLYLIDQGIVPFFNRDIVPACQASTDDNPMGNVLLSDYADRPDRPAACHYSRMKVKPMDFDKGRSRSAMPDVQQNAFARQWVTMPTTTIPGDQKSFAEGLYGKVDRTLCRDNQKFCDPDYWGVQMESFSGLDISGAPRKYI